MEGQMTEEIAPLPQRVLAYGLDLILAMTLAMILSTVWILPRYYHDALQLMIRLQSDGQTLNSALLQSLEPFQRESIFRLFGATQWFSVGILFLYFFSSEAMASGRTLGKRIFRLRVVSRNAVKSLTVFDILLRTFISTLCLTTFFPLLLVNFVWAFFRKDRRCWHDLIAGTRVVKC